MDAIERFRKDCSDRNLTVPEHTLPYVAASIAWTIVEVEKWMDIYFDGMHSDTLETMKGQMEAFVTDRKED